MKYCLMIALLYLFCNFSCSETAKQVEDKNVDIVTAVDSVFQITFDSNPTTGYSWCWLNRGSVSIVDSMDFDYIPSKPVLVGSGGKEIWKFIGRKSGIDSLVFIYERSWEPGSGVRNKTYVVQVR
jgi:predicted secreted protein